MKKQLDLGLSWSYAMFYHDACINLLPLCVYKVLDPTKRLGCDEMGGYSLLKADPFYEGK